VSPEFTQIPHNSSSRRQWRESLSVCGHFYPCFLHAERIVIDQGPIVSTSPKSRRSSATDAATIPGAGSMASVPPR
jgi:hypothetical protein